MAGKGAKGRRIGVLRHLVIFAVAAAALGMVFVVVHHGLGSRSVPAGNAWSERPPDGPATTGSADAPAGQSKSTTMSPKTADPKTPAAQSTGHDKPRLKQVTAMVAQRRKRAALALKTEPLVQRVWDVRTGELVVGRRRLLRKAKLARRLDLTDQQRKALKKFEDIFRGTVEAKLEQIEENLQSSRDAYHNSGKRSDTEGRDHYLDEHDKLSQEQDLLLDGLEQRYEEGLKDLLTDEQIEQLGQ